MRRKPSQDPAPGVEGGGAPASPNVGGPLLGDALPVEEGWGSKTIRWLRENVQFIDVSDEAMRGALWLILSAIAAIFFGYVVLAVLVLLVV